MKGLKRENRRNHMDGFDLILFMLGERKTTEIHGTEDSQRVGRLKDDMVFTGKIAGDARKTLEKRLGRPFVSPKVIILKRLQSSKKLRSRCQAPIIQDKEKT